MAAQLLPKIAKKRPFNGLNDVKAPKNVGAHGKPMSLDRWLVFFNQISLFLHQAPTSKFTGLVENKKCLA